MARGRGRKWLGGYVHVEADGSELFIIEKQVNGRRFHVSTRVVDDEPAALEHFARFQADPLGYDPAGVSPELPVVLTNELVLEHEQWSIEVKRNSTKHARSATRFLADWMDELGRKDLRRLTLADLHAALGKWKTSRQHRIIALKAFFGWMRKVKGLVKHAEDATLDLPVPQADPEKHRRRKAVSWELVREVFAHLEQEHYRDVLQLAVATGWHCSELARFCTEESSLLEPPGAETTTRDGRKVLAVLVTWHKTKRWTRTALVHQEHVEAALRLRQRRQWVGETRMRTAIAEALERADAKRRQTDPSWPSRQPFSLGQMRHSVATWSIELGDRPEQTAEALDHQDKRTTERFYADVLVPRIALTTRVLTPETRASSEPLN